MHFELGQAEVQRGNYPLGITHLREAVRLDKSQSRFHAWLGIALTVSGDLSSGARCYERALELAPDDPVVRGNLAANYKEQGRIQAAISQCEKAIELSSEYARPYLLLGEILQASGQSTAALNVYQAAASAGINETDVQAKLGKAFYDDGQYEAAADWFQKVAERGLKRTAVLSYLGSSLALLNRLDEAIACHKRAIEHESNTAFAYSSYGHTLTLKNDLSGAIACYRKSLEIQPDRYNPRANLLMVLNYFAEVPQSELYEEALTMGAQYEGRTAANDRKFELSVDKDRRLRIGYISPDFRAHSVALFMRNVLASHDSTQVETFCYAHLSDRNRDQVTAQFRRQSDNWLNIFALSDEEVAARIRNDRIDILVDLAGYTANSRLPVFAHNPAPIQVTWLGYPNTTGLSCIDYRLTDAIADPPGDADKWHSEKLVRLPHGFLCYQPEEPPTAVAASPHFEQGFVTFGSFNLANKTTPEVVRIWSAILNEIPGSRLLLKSKAFDAREVSQQFFAEFGRHGIFPERLDLLGRIENQDEHLEAYSRIDIALDPFPYNGTATTCEALWMGVPVISLLGDRHAGRVGASILTQVGLSEFVAGSEQDYLEKACALARNDGLLAKLREQIRPQMQASHLMDVSGFTRTLETEYRRMFHAWCDSRS